MSIGNPMKLAVLALPLTWLWLHAAAADTAKHPGILVGTGYSDQSGDSRYLPIKWCGELLFLQTESGPELLDPRTRKVVAKDFPPAVKENAPQAGLIGCSTLGKDTILWFDDGDQSIIWQSLKTGNRGSLRGFARSEHTWDMPLADMAGATVAIVAGKDDKVEADKLPPGMKFVTIPYASLAPTLGKDRLTDFFLLSDDIVELDAFRAPDEGAVVPTTRSNDTFIATIDLASNPPRIIRAVLLQDAFAQGMDSFVEWPKPAADDAVKFKADIAGKAQGCRLTGLKAGAPKADCTALPADYQTILERIDAKVHAYDRDASPSGRWVVWDEWIIDPDSPADAAVDGRVRFYLAPAVDLFR
jgi:hypothetical protein